MNKWTFEANVDNIVNAVLIAKKAQMCVVKDTSLLYINCIMNHRNTVKSISEVVGLGILSIYRSSNATFSSPNNHIPSHARKNTYQTSIKLIRLYINSTILDDLFEKIHYFSRNLRWFKKL